MNTNNELFPSPRRLPGPKSVVHQSFRAIHQSKHGTPHVTSIRRKIECREQRGIMIRGCARRSPNDLKVGPRCRQQPSGIDKLDPYRSTAEPERMTYLPRQPPGCQHAGSRRSRYRSCNSCILELALAHYCAMHIVCTWKNRKGKLCHSPPQYGHVKLPSPSPKPRTEYRAGDINTGFILVHYFLHYFVI